jgi:hypothetical protein
LNTVWNGVWSARFKHGNMEDWVYCMHSSRKTECPGQRSYLVNDIERSQIFFRKFLSGSSGSEELRFYKSLVSNLEFRRRDSVLVRGLLVAFLGLLNIDPELAMEFSEVGD